MAMTDKEGKTLDVLDVVIKQMCKNCKRYKTCQDVGEGPWESSTELLNPEKLAECVSNGFRPK